LLVSADYGGAGRDLLSAVAVLEGLGYGGRDNGIVFSLAAHCASCAGPLAAFGSAEQQRTWLPDLASGRAIAATGLTEPASGSSALSLTTTAVRDAEGWVLRGTKAFVTNAPIAHLFVVYARTGDGLGGVSCFLVPSSTAGLTVGPPIEKMGLRTSPMATVELDGCRLPGDSLVGGVGSGAMIVSHTLEIERVLIMAPAIGVMERVLERTVEYARRRAIGGTAIGKHQAVAHRIADMELQLESARLLLYRAAWSCMCLTNAARESALAKLAVSEAYVDVCRSALQVFGGYGYTVEGEVERELRDALAATLYVGTSELQRNLIAKLRGVG
jgi:alkylation response protein AidB-like acyl-CoA dehydrogenase